MSWIIDLIIVVIAGLCIFLGYKRGFAKCVIKVISFAVALIVAFMLYKPVGNIIIANTQFDDSIRGSITQIVEEDTEEDGNIKEDSNLPQSMVEKINKDIKTNVNQTKEKAVTTAADNISKTAVYACTGIGLFIITRIALIIVTKIFSILTDLPILKQFDKLGGIAYGVLQTLVIIFVIFGIISFISPMIESSGLISAINKSILGSALYNNNLLIKIIF